MTRWLLPIMSSFERGLLAIALSFERVMLVAIGLLLLVICIELYELSERLRDAECGDRYVPCDVRLEGPIQLDEYTLNELKRALRQ
jgi:hypothetical protein